MNEPLLTPELIRYIVDVYPDADGASDVIRAINGVTEPQPASRPIVNEVQDWTYVAMWLAIGAIGVAHAICQTN